jgi:hypothetical protein
MVILLSCTTTKASEPVWEIINLKSDEIIINNYIDILSSFDSDHLFSARSMIHIYVKDKNPVQLINFIDWDTYMNDISYKSDTAIVVYGVYYNFEGSPFFESSFVFEVIPRDTIPGQSWNKYAWESYSYDQGVFGNHRTIYSNVNPEGNGILVIQDSSKVMKFSN